MFRLQNKSIFSQRNMNCNQNTISLTWFGQLFNARLQVLNFHQFKSESYVQTMKNNNGKNGNSLGYYEPAPIWRLTRHLGFMSHVKDKVGKRG